MIVSNRLHAPQAAQNRNNSAHNIKFGKKSLEQMNYSELCCEESGTRLGTKLMKVATVVAVALAGIGVFASARSHNSYNKTVAVLDSLTQGKLNAKNIDKHIEARELANEAKVTQEQAAKLAK